MSKRLKTYSVIISDVVDYVTRIEARSEAEAHDKALYLFELGERDIHFTDRCETNVDVTEVLS